MSASTASVVSSRFGSPGGIDPGLVPAYRWHPTTDSASGFDTNIVGVGRKP